MEIPPALIIGEICALLRINNAKLENDWGFGVGKDPGLLFLETFLYCLSPDHPISQELESINSSKISMISQKTKLNYLVANAHNIKKKTIKPVAASMILKEELVNEFYIFNKFERLR